MRKELLRIGRLSRRAELSPVSLWHRFANSLAWAFSATVLTALSVLSGIGFSQSVACAFDPAKKRDSESDAAV
jgi:hypothetical protein